MSGFDLIRIDKDFAGIHALAGVSLGVRPGEVVGLVGPNGSGKTTLVNVATGTVRPTGGRILVDGADMTGAPPSRFAGAGVVRTFQALRLFEGMTVLDNVLVGAQRGIRPSLLAAWVRPPRFGRLERKLRRTAFDALGEVGMSQFALEPVTALSHGQRRRVEIARALAASPKYLVLDEPGAGVDPEHLEVLVGAVSRRRAAGAGVLVVEHDLGLVDRVCDRVVALVSGSVVAEGSFQTVERHPDLASVMGTRDC